MPKHEFREFPNESGAKPAGPKILLELEQIKDTYEGTNIVRPESTKDKEEHAKEAGILIACGPLAWSDQPEPWAQPGDKVIFSRYRGLLFSKNGKKYRLMDDLEIAGVTESLESWEKSKIDEHRN